MLLETILGGLNQGPVFVSPVKTLDVLALASRINEMETLRAACSGQAIGLWVSDPLEFSITALVLHEYASQLLLIPFDATPEMVGKLVALSGTQKLISDISGAEQVCSTIKLGRLTTIESNICATKNKNTCWILTTSGTTGTPKLVNHQLESLCATARRDTQKGASITWGLIYDPARFAGLQVMLQAILGGSPIVFAPPTLSLDEKVEFFQSAGVNALSATPTLWRKLLMSGVVQKLNLKVITLGGEIADQQILNALTGAFPAAKIRHIYASTEAGVGFSVSDNKEGFPSVWLDAAPSGVRLDIDSQGQLLIRSSRLAKSYLGESEFTDSSGWFPSGDIVKVDGDRVHFLGRMNGAINVGGDKVFPETVERVILSHPAVFSATVLSRKSSFAGALVEAVVTLSQEFSQSAELKDSILNHCRSHLPKFAVPALLRFADCIEHSNAGKQQRRS